MWMQAPAPRKMGASLGAARLSQKTKNHIHPLVFLDREAVMALPYRPLSHKVGYSMELTNSQSLASPQSKQSRPGGSVEEIMAVTATPHT